MNRKILFLFLACFIPCIAKPKSSFATCCLEGVHGEFYPSRSFENINKINSTTKIDGAILKNNLIYSRVGLDSKRKVLISYRDGLAGIKSGGSLSSLKKIAIINESRLTQRNYSLVLLSA